MWDDHRKASDVGTSPPPWSRECLLFTAMHTKLLGPEASRGSLASTSHFVLEAWGCYHVWFYKDSGNPNLVIKPTLQAHSAHAWPFNVHPWDMNTGLPPYDTRTLSTETSPQVPIEQSTQRHVLSPVFSLSAPGL